MVEFTKDELEILKDKIEEYFDTKGYMFECLYIGKRELEIILELVESEISKI